MRVRPCGLGLWFWASSALGISLVGLTSSSTYNAVVTSSIQIVHTGGPKYCVVREAAPTWSGNSLKTPCIFGNFKIKVTYSQAPLNSFFFLYIVASPREISLDPPLFTVMSSTSYSLMYVFMHMQEICVC